MDINTLQALNAYQATSGKTYGPGKDRTNKEIVLDSSKITAPSATDKVLSSTDKALSTTDNQGVVLEKSELIKSLQNDAQARAKQLQDLVADSLRTQAGLYIGGDDVWKFLASGNYTVTAAAKEAAQEAISENGYYGVEQTSDRIVQFAKALSGGDVSKADELLDAFKKGYKEATGAWGKELPEICKKTYKAVEEKFDAWKNGTEKSTGLEE